MSIIIKGLNMPKASNEDCMAVIRSNGKVEVWQTGMREFEAEAIQIPTPHGRLIDANKLEAMMYHEAFEIDSDMQKWDSGCWIRYKVFENCMNRLLPDTVIEAED